MPVLAQQQGQKVDKKVEKAQQFDIQSVVGATDAAMAGQPATDIKLTFRNDFLKAQEGKTYVPFTVTFDQAQAPAGKIADDVHARGRQGHGRARAAR